MVITLLVVLYLFALQCIAQHDVQMNKFEFDNHNQSKWKAVFKRADCGHDAKEYLTHSCNTANLANVRLVDGSLVLTALEQAYFDSKFTTASVHLNISDPKPVFNLKEGTLVFRLRAALPLLAVPGLTPKIILVYGVDTGSDGQHTFSMNLLNFVHSARIDRSTHLDDFNDYEIAISGNDVQTLINGVALVRKTISEPIFVSNAHNMSIQAIAVNVVVDENKVSSKTSLFAKTCTSFVLDYLTYHYRPNHLATSLNVRNSNRSESSIQDICKVVKQSDNTIIKFVPNENYTNLLQEYTFDDNMTMLDRDLWVYRDNNTMDKCDGVQPFHMQYEPNDKQQGKLFSCDFATYEIKQGHLRVKHSGHADMRTALATKADFSNVRIEIKARAPSSKLFGSFHLHDDHRQYQHIGEEFELRQRAETKHKGRYEGWVEVARLFGGGDVQTVLQLSKTYHIGSEVSMTKVDEDGWLVFGIEWTEEYIIWYVKDRVIFQTNRLRDQKGNYLINIDEYVSYLPFEYPFRLYILVGDDYRNLTDKNIQYNDNRPWVEIEYIKVYGRQAADSLLSMQNDLTLFGASITGGTIGVFLLIVGLGAILSATLVVLTKTKRKLMIAKKVELEYDDIGIREDVYQDYYYDYDDYCEIPDAKVAENDEHGTIKRQGNEYLQIKHQESLDASPYVNLVREPHVK